MFSFFSFRRQRWDDGRGVSGGGYENRERRKAANNNNNFPSLHSLKRKEGKKKKTVYKL
jgi:hypothetical protein